MSKDKSLHLTQKQLGLADNPTIKNESPLASDAGETKMTMVERVAEALFKKRNPNSEVSFNELYPRTKAHFIDEARAAIKAMREPTQEMIEAGSKGYPKFQLAYLNMINAALKE